MFIDLRGFTAFTDSAEPEEVIAVLAEFHGAMGELIDGARGHGAALHRRRHPDLLQRPDRGRRTRARAPRAWRSRCRRASCRCASAGAQQGHELELGIGIARGYATLGAIGYEGRFDYTAIGSVVNLAARLCCGGVGRPDPASTGAPAPALTEGYAVEPLAPLTLKGYDKPVPAFRLTGGSD